MKHKQTIACTRPFTVDGYTVAPGTVVGHIVDGEIVSALHDKGIYAGHIRARQHYGIFSISGDASAKTDPPPAPSISAAAAALAEDYGLELTGVTGTGKDGQITKSDVQALIDLERT